MKALGIEAVFLTVSLFLSASVSRVLYTAFLWPALWATIVLVVNFILCLVGFLAMVKREIIPPLDHTVSVWPTGLVYVRHGKRHEILWRNMQSVNCDKRALEIVTRSGQRFVFAAWQFNIKKLRRTCAEFYNVQETRTVKEYLADQLQPIFRMMEQHQ